VRARKRRWMWGGHKRVCSIQLLVGQVEDDVQRTKDGGRGAAGLWRSMF